jgi:hypothetical protein
VPRTLILLQANPLQKVGNVSVVSNVRIDTLHHSLQELVVKVPAGSNLVLLSKGRQSTTWVMISVFCVATLLNIVPVLNLSVLAVTTVLVTVPVTNLVIHG